MRVPDPREVSKLAAALIEAEDRLRSLRESWEALFMPGGVESAEQAATLADRILEMLDSDPTTSFTAPQVARQLSANPNSVGPILSRLVREDKIAKAGYGAYRSRGEIRTGDTFFSNGPDDPTTTELNDHGPVALPS